MTTYSMHLMLVSLTLTDTPVGYTAPLGPPVLFTASYHQKEANQPATFFYSNLGQKWTCNWIAYITDNPTSPNGDVSFYVDGGGTFRFTAFNTNTQSYDHELMTQALLVKTSSSSYEMRFRDGSKKLFELNDGSSGTSRRVFLTKVFDSAGNYVQLNYDSQLRMTNLVDAIGQSTTLSYTNATFPFAITSVTDPFGRTAYFQYNASGLLSQITDVLGLTSQYTYDNNDFVTTLTTPYGTTSFYAGSTNGVSWLQATDPLGESELLEFSQNQVVPFNDPPAKVPHGMGTFNAYLHGRNSFFWDKNAHAAGAGDITHARIYHFLHRPDLTTESRVLESVKAPLEGRVWYNYPGQPTNLPVCQPCNNSSGSAAIQGTSSRPALAARVLDEGTTQVRLYRYDAFGNITNTTDPLGRNFTYVYDTNGVDLLETRMTHNAKNELISRTAYNAQHKPILVTDASGQTTTNTYNARGQVMTSSDPTGATTTFLYDTNGYLLTITGPLQNSNDITSFTYDGLGRIRTATDTEGYTLTLDYDAMDRRTRTTYPDGTSEQFVYDRLDRVARSDRLGRWTTNTYNAIRQLVQSRDPLGRVTQYQWCRCGQLSSLTDPMGRQTVWRYNVEGRVTGKRYADGSETMLVYDNTSRLKARYDEQGQGTVFEYDPDDSLKRVSYPNATVPTATVSYIYDPDYPRVLAMMDGIGTTVYSYYPITALPVLGAGRLASIVGPLINSTVTYQYDAGGRTVSRAINGVAVATTYDAEARESMVSNVLGAFQYAYVGATARYASEAYPNGQTNHYSYYDNVGDHRLKQLLHLKPDGSLLSACGYGYDTAGQVLVWTNTFDTSRQTVWTLGYDPANELETAVLRNSARVQESHTYAYDLAGNRLVEQLLSSTNQFTYNALNQLVVATTDTTNATYEWDAEHRLAAINSGAQRVECSYDGRGQRVGIRTLLNGAEVTNRLFLWCDSEICEERNSTGASVKRFYPQGMQVATGLATGSLYYTLDALGSVRELTDRSGAVQALYFYDPFGRRTLLAGTLEADFGFAGMFWSTEVGLNLTLFRGYDPNTGRWLSRDPLPGTELRQGPNLYLYVSNDPVNHTDLLGLCCEKELQDYTDKLVKANKACKSSINKPTLTKACRNAINDERIAAFYLAQCVKQCNANPDKGPACGR